MPLLALEGLHGAGKSSGAAALAALLSDRGSSVLVTQANSDERLGALRYELRKSGGLTDPEFATLLELTELSLRYGAAIQSAMESGAWVIADRYFLTMLAKSSLRGCPRLVNSVSDQFSIPDAEFLIDLPSAAAARRGMPGCDQIWMIGLGKQGDPEQVDEAAYIAYQEELRDSFLAAARDRTTVVVDGLLPPGEVLDAMVEHLSSEGLL
jgi:dTMP kinase